MRVIREGGRLREREARKGEGDAKASAKDGSGKPLKTHL